MESATKKPIVADEEHLENATHTDPGRRSDTIINKENYQLENPLSHLSHEEVKAKAAEFTRRVGLGEEHIALMQRGGLVAQNPLAFETVEGLTEEEKVVFRREITHKWSQPKELYWMVAACSMAAAVQGMDESVINGAQLFFPGPFGIDGKTGKDPWILGLTTGSPYLACAVLGCWLTDPLNRALGRKGAIFVTAFISFLGCFWSSFTSSWWHLFIARFFLGIGIGAKSSTVPIYAAECSPAPIRGALVMMWQTWTAFGIFVGYVMDIAFYKVKDTPNIYGLNWRLMLGSAGVPALFVMAQVLYCPESPRWLISKGRHIDAFKSLQRLRGSDIQAARDLFYISAQFEEEERIFKSRNRYTELFTVARNRRAALASYIVMFGQQFCGINVIAYYSSSIFVLAGLSQVSALAASIGFGALNTLFAIPAIYTIDTFGRRNLLLVSFPLMGLFLLLTGACFYIKPFGSNASIGLIALFIYLFTIAYSPGEGPVPFTYSAEAYPISVRDVGMSFSTATLWFWNFIVALTFPSLLAAFTPMGAFGWYAAWNIILALLVFFFLPETKALTLEELDSVFSVPSMTHARYQTRQLPWYFKKYILRQKVGRKEALYQHEELDYAENKQMAADEFAEKARGKTVV